MDFIKFILVALLAEFTLERIQAMVPYLAQLDKKYAKISIMLVLGFVVALPLTYLMGADFFEMIGQEVVQPYVGLVFTALFASGGSKVAHDIIDRITATVED